LPSGWPFEMPVAPAVDATPGASLIFRKTKLCKFNRAGRCVRKGACRFAHSAAELEPLPNFRFTRMCPELSGAGCFRGVACSFAHTESELRAPTKGTARGAMVNAAPAVAKAPVWQVFMGAGGMGLILQPNDVGVLGSGSDADRDSAICSDNPSGGWSHTTEGAFEEPPGEFSRQNSEESAWGTEERSPREHKRREEAFRGGGGLTYVIKNTFLQFDDQEGGFCILRRVSSTGSCAVRGA